MCAFVTLFFSSRLFRNQAMVDVFAPGLFKDQVFLITGGGTGIGLTIGRRALELGGKLAICGRTQATLDASSKELIDAGFKEVFAVACDIRQDEEVEKTVKAVLARFGRIDVLINNAGGQFRTLAEDCKPKVLKKKKKNCGLLVCFILRTSGFRCRRAK